MIPENTNILIKMDLVGIKASMCITGTIVNIAVMKRKNDVVVKTKKMIGK